MRTVLPNLLFRLVLGLSYLALSLALLANGHALEHPELSKSCAPGLSKEKESPADKEKNLPILKEAPLEAVVNAPATLLPGHLLLPMPLLLRPQLPLVLGGRPLLLPRLAYWQNTFGHIIVINAP
ncbi:MAG: hypothetical protein HC913_24105 [Microscillaceae bacterium]|nr:hypothetical protein [Microscillaceae bacterium]